MRRGLMRYPPRRTPVDPDMMYLLLEIYNYNESVLAVYHNEAIAQRFMTRLNAHLDKPEWVEYKVVPVPVNKSFNELNLPF
jgi:hypothetical protein